MRQTLQAGAVPLARGAGGVAVVLGFVVLLGWALEIGMLKTIVPTFASMKANTALAFIGIGAALLAPRHGRLIGLAVALLGAATLAQDLLGVDFGIDEVLVRDPDTPSAAAPGRMSPATAFCFVLAGVAAALLATPGREGAAQWLALGVLAVAMVALAGYAYDVRDLYHVDPYNSMALHTALGVLVLAAGLLAARRDRGWMRGVTSAGPGGAMLRQVLIPGAVALFLIGWLRVLAGERALFDVGFGTALMVFAGTLVLAGLSWRFARELDAAAQLIEGQHRCLELVATGAPLARVHEELARTIEAQVPGMLCSILLIEDGVRLRHSAAPSLPEAFVRAVDGRLIGPAEGSCGTAAYTRKAVIAEDVGTDPRWAYYRDFALPHGLRACWSTPVFDEEGRVLATFALYYREARRPDRAHQRLIELATHTVAISMQRQRAEAALRSSESRLRLAMRASNIGLWDWDIARNRVFYSREWKGQLGYEEEEIGEGLDEWESRVHPQDRERTLERVRPLLAQPGGAFEAEFRMRHRKDGSWRWIHARGEVLFDEEGRAKRMLGCHIDITERKAAEDQVRSLTRRLLRAEENERRALSRELHDRVGQNLSAIDVNLQLIREQLARGAAEQAAARIEDAQRLLRDTTRDVRDVMVELRPPGLDDYGLATALRNYAERIVERIPARLAVLGEDPAPRPPLDTEMALFRIAQEAVTNAAKHSQATNIEIRIEDSAHGTRLTVADDGVGFGAEAASAPSWGLAIMRERAEAVGARFEVRSLPGAGSRITAEVPR